MVADDELSVENSKSVSHDAQQMANVTVVREKELLIQGDTEPKSGKPLHQIGRSCTPAQFLNESESDPISLPQMIQ